MGAIAGIWNWDGQPISREFATILAEQSASGGPNCGSVSPLPELLLQTHIRPFDRLSALERQPVVLANGSVLTWDGRLDNRDDLLLNLHRLLNDDQSDAALVAAAYARWGLDAWPRLIGDWSLALWDAAERQIVLARDYMGNRPLFYRAMPTGLAWATHRDALATCYDLYEQPDDAFIVGHLTHGVPPDRTSLQSLCSVLSGHVLVASPSHGVRTHRFWTCEPDRIRYRHKQDYTEHLRHLLSEAVRVRLRADRTVWTHLSGGWDSSSIVCIGHSLVQRGLVQARGIQPVSRVRAGAPESEERKHMSAVERWCNLPAIQCDTPLLPTFAELLAERHPVLFGRSNVERNIQRLVEESGDYLLMTGEAGDFVMQRSSTRIALLEPLIDGHPLQFLRVCVDRASSRRRSILIVLGGLAIEALPYGLRAAVRRAVHPSRWRATGNTFDVPDAVLARAPKPHAHWPRTDHFAWSKRDLASMIYRHSERAGINDADLAPRVWYTHPYTHRPLVEYVLAIPQLALWDPRVYRAGMRRGLADVLPPEILNRPDKGNLATWFVRTNREQLDAFMSPGGVPPRAEDWILVQRGYLDKTTLAKALVTAKSGQFEKSTLRKNWVVLEAWLRRNIDKTTNEHHADIELSMAGPPNGVSMASKSPVRVHHR